MRHLLSDRVRRTLSLTTVFAVAFGFLAIPSPAAAQGGGTIEGLVYADLDLDGQSGPDEPGLGGVIVRLTDENNTSTTVLTDLNGSYTFDDLDAGDYDIKVETGRDFTATTLASYDGIAVDDNSLTGLDFGLDAETSAAEAIVDQAISVAEASAEATEESMDADDEASDDDESMDDDADADSDDEDMDDDGDDDDGDDDDGDMDDDADHDDDDEDMDDDGDHEDGDMDDDADHDDDDDAAGDGDDSDEMVDEMPETGFADMGVAGMLAFLALGMAGLAAAGVWRERRVSVTR